MFYMGAMLWNFESLTIVCVQEWFSWIGVQDPDLLSSGLSFAVLIECMKDMGCDWSMVSIGSHEARTIFLLGGPEQRWFDVNDGCLSVRWSLYAVECAVLADPLTTGVFRLWARVQILSKRTTVSLLYFDPMIRAYVASGMLILLYFYYSLM
jgi:hypothetical protein